MPSDPVQAAWQVIQALEALGVSYLIGGSLASTVHGFVRTTQDADLVAELRPEHAAPLASALAVGGGHSGSSTIRMRE